MDKFSFNFLGFVTGTASVIFWFVVLLIPLVVIHEFGHLIMARLCGVKVPEFAVGLPFSRRLFYKKWKGIIWSFYPWLLGGFVRLSGDNDAADNAHWELKNNPKLAREIYQSQRKEEILQAQELQFFLEENHLSWDNRWKWYEQIAKIGTDNPKAKIPEWVKSDSQNSAKDIKFVPKSKLKDLNKIQESEITQSQIENEFGKTSENNLNLEKTTIIQKEFTNLDDQLSTLVDWEWETKIDEKGKKTLFFAKSWWQQSLIISGGVLFNLITAMVVFWIVFVFFGSFPSPYNKAGEPYFDDKTVELLKSGNGLFSLSHLAHPQVIALEKDGVLEKAGLKPRDILIKIGENKLDSQSVKSFEEFKNVVQKYKDQTVELTFAPPESDGNPNTFKKVQITPTTNKDGKAVLGVLPAYIVTTKASNWPNGVKMAANEIGDNFRLTFEWFGKAGQALLPNSKDRSALSQTSGPIGVGFIGSKVFEIAGLGGALYLVGIISVSLAIFNMLPIPALDGGRFLILTINKLTGKRNKKLEAILINVTFIFLFGMMILVAFKDLWGIVMPK